MAEAKKASRYKSMLINSNKYIYDETYLYKPEDE